MTAQHSPHVYDKSKYHAESVAEYGLPDEHCSNHAVFFLRWLIEKNFLSEEFLSQSKPLAEFRAGERSIHSLYEWWDCCLVDDMLSEEGNAFALHYFDFNQGQYLEDYAELLQASLPSEFHVEYTESNYQLIAPVIDRRYAEWKEPPKRPWWRFWDR